MSSSAHAVSAPGKVLLAGGYLVLDSAYTGLVFGLDARIHVTIKDLENTEDASLAKIIVKSPQFDEPAWQYSFRSIGDGTGIEVTQLSIASQPLNRNPFVETTLRYVLSYVAETIGDSQLKPSSITILADNDYYTTSRTSQQASRFYNFAVPLSKANKTGLGSSAALVTSLSAALLRYYLPNDNLDLRTEEGKQRLHNLAQAAHCAAQGKVGSGFDVASAVFGSCIYRRFSPQILSSLPEPGSAGFAKSLQQTVDSEGVQWDYEIKKGQLAVPQGLRMVMCDVSCGSQTPGMVKKVLAWRKEKPEEAETIWQNLNTANINLAQQLQDAAGSNDYTGLSQAFAAIRAQIRLMGERSDVPIEPPAQTRLIDACCKLDGVIGGTVPGAGGYDAIVLLIEDKPTVTDALERLFADWQFDGSDGGQGKVSMLGVREELEGVRDEEAATYREWTSQ